MPQHINVAKNAAEKARSKRATSAWRTGVRRASLASAAIATLLISGLAAGASPATAVGADGYPTWEEVQAAKNNESLKTAEIANINSLISSLETNVATTKQASIEAGDAYFNANQDYVKAKAVADDLQTQADAEASTAKDASTKVGQVASQLYRDGGDDTALKLVFSEDGKQADDLLNQLGQMDKLVQRNQTVYNDAVVAKNSAQSLTDQAKVARDERDRLKQVAEQAFADAQAAATAAADALTAQQSNLMVLQAQLAALEDETTKVTTQYEIGVEERRKAEEAAEAARIAEAQRLAAEAEAARQAAEEARRAAEEAAANQPQPSNPDPPGDYGGGGGDYGGGESAGGGGGTPSIGNDGWVRPSNGWQTSGYGPRYSQCGPSYCMSSFHEGVDLASGCGSAIYAAHSGTVSYAGYNGGYGNYVRINNGDGIGTGYGHIQDGGILVSNGQWVNAGDLIALEGDTGNSFGCHVHYEVYMWGDTVNPIDFMAGKGIYL